MVDSNKSGNSNSFSIKENLIKITELLLSGGVFTALLYFLGRLHLNAYYSTLGISPSNLVFKTEDYMFSSFDLIIMCILVILEIILCLKLMNNKEDRMSEIYSLYDNLKSKNSKGRVYFRLFWIVWGFLVADFLTNGFFGFQLSGLTGLSAGFVVGGLVFIIVLAGNAKPDTNTKYGYFFAILLTFMLALLPFVTNRLAEFEVRNDIGKFPHALVICNDFLPTQLSDDSGNLTNVIRGQIILTNNNITYILQSDYSIYTIPVEKIVNVKYDGKQQ